MRCSISPSDPVASLALISETYVLSKCLGYLLSATEKSSPPSTDFLRSLRTLRSVGFFSCSRMPCSAAASVMPVIDHHRQLVREVDDLVARNGAGTTWPVVVGLDQFEHRQPLTPQEQSGFVAVVGFDRVFLHRAAGVARLIR